MAKRQILCASGVLFILLGCQQHTTEPTTTEVATKPADQNAERATTQIRDSIRDVTDVMVKQAAAANETKKDPAVTDAIKQYEALSPRDRVRFVVENKAQLGAITGTMPDPDDPYLYPQRLQMLLMAGRPDERAKVDFNLALAQTDVIAKQVKLTNELFGDMNAKSMSALEAYNKMTPQQKQTFIATPSPQAYYFYWNYMYLLRKLALLRYYRIYTAETQWGYKSPVALEKKASLDRRFDLKTAAR